MNKIEQAFSNIQNGKHQHGWPQFLNRLDSVKLYLP
jgi:hypothetical protein